MTRITRQHYPAAEIDLEPDAAFHDIKPGDDLNASLAWDVLNSGMNLAKDAGLPVLLVNEPILISNGQNSDIRYDFYYPRWAYDAYRAELKRQADRGGWNYLDAWDAVPMQEFTNSAIHLTMSGEELLAGQVIGALQQVNCSD